MGSFKSKLTDDTAIGNDVEQEQSKLDREKVASDSGRPTTTTADSRGVAPIPRNQYFRSLRATTRKQISNMNKNFNNSSSTKLFNNLLRSKSNAEFHNKQRYNRTLNSRQLSQQTAQAQAQQEPLTKPAVDSNQTAFITNKLKSASITKSSTQSMVDEEKSVKQTVNEANKSQASIDNNNVNMTSSMSESNSNYYYTEEDYEWDAKNNKQNDDLIEALKDQIGALNKQLETLGKEDSKLITDLSAKIEELARMNHTIMSNIEIQTQRKAQKNYYKRHKEIQKQRLLDEYHNRIRQQNEVLLNQQNQINELRSQFINNTSNQSQSNLQYSNSFSESYYSPPPQAAPQPQPQPESTQGIYTPHSAYYYTTNSHYHRPQRQAYYYTTTTADQEAEQQPTYYMYYRQHRQPRQQRYHENYRSGRGQLYYDPVTGCYYYQRIVPTTTTPTPAAAAAEQAYYYASNSRPNYYVYTQYNTNSEYPQYRRDDTKNDEDDHSSGEDSSKPGVIITEVDDDEDENKNKNKKRDYVDAVSID